MENEPVIGVTEAKLVAINSIAKTTGGEALVDILNDLIHQAKNSLVEDIRADDYTQISGAQATVKICRLFRWYLESELEDLLTAFGIEKEEDEA
jgi:hypothetical protein